ncbi:MAG: hypothetical protein LWX56_02375 [Ignavibacteria bacterium]|nr:hypothetical protein [Ignavibacteria bacterium]
MQRNVIANMNVVIIWQHYTLSVFGLAEKPASIPPGYFIPMWTNAGTYLKDAHVDFGETGPITIPFILGFAVTLCWYKFYDSRSITWLVPLVYGFVVIGTTPTTALTRSMQWFFTLIVLTASTPIFEKLVKYMAARKKTTVLVSTTVGN